MQVLLSTGCAKQENNISDPLVGVPRRSTCFMGANPALDPKTDALLRFIQNLKNQPGKRIMAGQNSNISHKTQYKLGDNQIIHPFAQATGKYPAIVGSDFNRCGQLESSFAVPERPEQAAWMRYRDLRRAQESRNITSGSDLSALLPGGSLRAQWVNHMDSMAASWRILADKRRKHIIPAFPRNERQLVLVLYHQLRKLQGAVGRPLQLFHQHQKTKQPHLDHMRPTTTWSATAPIPEVISRHQLRGYRGSRCVRR